MIYVDRHATYKVNHPQDLFDEEMRTRFRRGMMKLWIAVIYASTPEWKWRVERSFWTHQDRLIKSLTLEWITTIDEANTYLREKYIPKHNTKFAKQPTQSWDYHKSFTDIEKENFKWYFAKISQRVIKKDWTIAYNNKIYQVRKWTILLNNKSVDVLETMEWEIRLMSKDKILHFEVRNKS